MVTGSTQRQGRAAAATDQQLIDAIADADAIASPEVQPAAAALERRLPPLPASAESILRERASADPVIHLYQRYLLAACLAGNEHAADAALDGIAARLDQMAGNLQKAGRP